MTISVNFTGQANESPWVDALFNQSNPYKICDTIIIIDNIYGAN